MRAAAAVMAGAEAGVVMVVASSAVVGAAARAWAVVAMEWEAPVRRMAVAQAARWAAESPGVKVETAAVSAAATGLVDPVEAPAASEAHWASA